MAVLTSPDRQEAYAELMRRMSDERQTVDIVKADLRAALDAVDQWVSDNQASFNTAIPQPARGSLSASQKALLLLYVVNQRYVKGV